MAAILKEEPEWGKLPPMTTENVRCLLRRCLEKEPHCRLRDIGDARIELEESLGIRKSTRSGPAASPSVTKRLAVAAVSVALALDRSPSPPGRSGAGLEWSNQSPALASNWTPASASWPVGTRHWKSLRMAALCITSYPSKSAAFRLNFGCWISSSQKRHRSARAARRCFRPTANGSASAMIPPGPSGGPRSVVARRSHYLLGLVNRGFWGTDGYLYWTPGSAVRHRPYPDHRR